MSLHRVLIHEYHDRPPRWELWFAWYPVYTGKPADNEQQAFHNGGWKWLTTVARSRPRYEGERQIDLATAFGVTQALISSVVRGVTWA